jgi:glycosyltransferase involved in cell wall biosynthesis
MFRILCCALLIVQLSIGLLNDEVAKSVDTVESNAVDIHWVMSTSNIHFNGFFVELLGYASGLSLIFPMMRLTKSFYALSLNENPFGNDYDHVLMNLFPDERESIQQLMSDMYQDSMIKNVPYSGYLQETPIMEEGLCLNASSWHQSVLVSGNECSKSRPLLPVATATACCLACVRFPSCLTWTYSTGKDDDLDSSCIIHRQHYLPNQLVSISATSPDISFPKVSKLSYHHRTYVGVIPTRNRFPKPRVIVLHGTNCFFRNESISGQRGIDTIIIGRFMLERADLLHGITADEFAVMMCMHYVDELWVPTEWHHHAFSRLFKKQSSKPAPPITVIGESVNSSIFSPVYSPFRKQEREIDVSISATRGKISFFRKENVACAIELDAKVNCFPDNEVFEFLSIFKWENRKGWDLLLSAFISSFSARDKVRLRIYTNLPSTDNGGITILEAVKHFVQSKFPEESVDLFPRIEIFETVGWKAETNESFGNFHFRKLPRELSRSDMRHLYGTADAFVLPTRGEGWGLPIAEAMSMALPVIVSDAPGPREYANSENAYIIRIANSNDDYGFVLPDVDHLSTLMRQVIVDSSENGNFEAQRKGGRARQDMIENWQADRLVAQMDERIRYQLSLRGWKY